MRQPTACHPPGPAPIHGQRRLCRSRRRVGAQARTTRARRPRTPPRAPGHQPCPTRQVRCKAAIHTDTALAGAKANGKQPAPARTVGGMIRSGPARVQATAAGPRRASAAPGETGSPFAQDQVPTGTIRCSTNTARQKRLQPAAFPAMTRSPRRECALVSRPSGQQTGSATREVPCTSVWAGSAPRRVRATPYGTSVSAARHT